MIAKDHDHDDDEQSHIKLLRKLRESLDNISDQLKVFHYRIFLIKCILKYHIN